MKKIGLIGGVTWVSTQDYYRGINEKINANLGGFHSADMIMYSIDFQELMPHLQKGDWRAMEDAVSEKVTALKNGGVDFFTIASNTTSKVGKTISHQVGLPFVDIFEATASAVKAQNMKRVALLGTGFTMKDPFYLNELNGHGLDTVLPNSIEIDEIDGIIFNELSKGVITAESKNSLLGIMKRTVDDDHCEGVILGCTELPLLIGPEDTDIPLFNTTKIHVDEIVEYALNGVDNLLAT